jgi:hypothetical protein
MKEFELLIKQSKRLEVKPINQTTGKMGDMWEVGNYIVRIFNKKGRKLITCTCQNNDKFINQPTICIHKMRLLNYLSYNVFEEKLKEIKEIYEAYATNKLPIKSEMIFSDLQSLEDSIKR